MISLRFFIYLPSPGTRKIDMMTPTKKDESHIADLSDQEVVKAILNRDKNTTYEYLYKKCYPLFKSIYTKYYTDCDTCMEFINDIYVLIMSPGKHTGTAQLANFKFGCTLTFWLKIVAENHCKALYKKRPNTTPIGDNLKDDRFTNIAGAKEIDLTAINKTDLQKVLIQVKPARFRQILEHVYLRHETNEEAAKALNMSRNNFNTKHFIARQKLINILKKEGLI